MRRDDTQNREVFHTSSLSFKNEDCAGAEGEEIVMVP